MSIYAPPIPATTQAALDVKVPLPTTAVNPLTGYYHADGFSGVDKTGAADSTAGVQAALDALPTNGTLYFSGTYRFDSAVTVPSFVTLLGGGRSSRLNWTGSGVFITLTNKHSIKFRSLQVVASHSTGTLFTLSNTFRCVWTSCSISGSYVGPSVTGPYLGQTGIVFTANAGDNHLIDCDVINLGIGVKTDCIQNYISGCKFGTNNNHIYGSGGGGMSISDVTFVANATNCEVGINMVAVTSQWWLEHVWLEGALVGIRVDNPTYFGMTDCKVAATTTDIDIVASRWSDISGVQFSSDAGATPTPLVINATNAFQGKFSGDSIIAAQLSSATFPSGWLATFRTSGGGGLTRAPAVFDLPPGGQLRMARASDNVYVNTIDQISGPGLRIRGPQSGGAAALIKFTNNGGETVLDLASVSAPVNNPVVTPSVSGNPVIVGAAGTDTNISVRVAGKGVGGVQIGTGTHVHSGTGAPTLSGTAGDFYFRTDTPATVNQRIYVCTGTTNWTGIL